MTTQVQSALRSGAHTLDSLESTFAIKAKRHNTHPNLVLLKYNQIESPFAERIVQECRGIILDEADGWRVVSRAFDKFFNAGEGHAAEIDWSTARVQEKLDGSLCCLYFYAGDWHVATSGTPDASGRIGYLQRDFASLFWDAYRNTTSVQLPEAPDFCFYFELTSPHNRVVVPYTETRLTLLGARHLESGLEIGPDVASAMLYDFPHVREFPLSDSESIVASFASMSPLQQEGYVICDATFNRIKVKHPGYVALHHAKDGMGLRAFVDIARAGETPEVIVAFPEFAEQLGAIREKYEAFVAEVTADYERARGIEAQKDFAREALKSRCSSALFCARNGKSASVRAHLQEMPADRMIDLLGLKGEPVANQEAA